MTNKRHYSALLAGMALMALLLTGCAHRKNVVAGKNTPTADKGQDLREEANLVVTAIHGNRQKSEYLTSRANIEINVKDKRTSLSGNLRMKRDDVIQLSLTALGIMEVGRLELTEDYLMVVDRIGKQYVKVPYEEVPGIRQAGIDFHSFQSLFWDELFLPGDKGEKPHPEQFSVGKAGEGPGTGSGQVAITQAQPGNVIITFLASVAQSVVEQTTVSLSSSKHLVDWKYSDFGTFQGQPFPMRMTIQIPASTSPISATFTLRTLKNDKDWETRTQINEGRYKSVSIDSVMKRITQIAR